MGFVFFHSAEGNRRLKMTRINTILQSPSFFLQTTRPNCRLVFRQENRGNQKEKCSLCGPNGKGIWEDPWEDLPALRDSLKHFSKVVTWSKGRVGVVGRKTQTNLRQRPFKHVFLVSCLVLVKTSLPDEITWGFQNRSE